MNDKKTIIIAVVAVVILIVIVIVVALISAKNQQRLQQQQIIALQTKLNSTNTSTASGTNKATALNSIVTGVKDLAPLLLLL